MSDTTTNSLRQLFDHHANHEIGKGEVLPFVDIYVDDQKVLQFSHGRLNLTGKISDTEEIELYLQSVEELSEENHGGFTEWILPNDWDADQAFQICQKILQKAGYEVEDVTHAVEQDCPTKGMFDLEDISTRDTNIVHDSSVEDPEEQLKSVYQHLRELEIDAKGVPSPFPLVNFYVDNDKLPYVFGPGVHGLDWHSDEERDQFDNIVANHSDLEATAGEKSSISISHYGWTPDDAFTLTKKFLDELYGISVDEIEYAEIVTGGPKDNTPWTDI